MEKRKGPGRPKKHKMTEHLLERAQESQHTVEVNKYKDRIRELEADNQKLVLTLLTIKTVVDTNDKLTF